MLEASAEQPVLLAFGDVHNDVRVGVMVNLDAFNGRIGVLQIDDLRMQPLQE